MSAPRPYEQELLAPAELCLERLAGEGAVSHAERMEVLEAAASLLGGFDLEGYHEAMPLGRTLASGTALAHARRLVEVLRQHVPIHPSLALTSLARPPLSAAEQRKAGAYFTDFRLAQFLASQVEGGVEQSVVDLASGTGILLVALGLHLSAGNPEALRRFVAHSVHAADLSGEALRGAALALASLTSDLAAIRAMAGRLHRGDSLLLGEAGWRRVVPDGFQVLVGNPPWEKLKVTRHELLLAEGIQRHYGSGYVGQDHAALEQERTKMAVYVRTLRELYTLQGDTEADLYKAFLELSLQLARPEGQVALLVPAGLIRAQGTEDLRQHLFERSASVEMAVLDNKTRFFAIDTRFKFLALRAYLAEGNPVHALTLHHARGQGEGVEVTDSVHINLADLRAARPDLSPPEVRSDAEWATFAQMYRAAPTFDDPGAGWQPKIVREVDMTRDEDAFETEPRPGLLPVIEGRMVQQHHFGAKAYVCGTGRSALWRPQAPFASEVVPQFRISPRALRSAMRARVSLARVGFCDIAGQTNERAMMAARIPADVVCGNKVPTVTFEGAVDGPEIRPELFLGVMNSLPFDWLLRRVLTTTVNFFILLGLPVPRPEGVEAERVAELVLQLEGETDPWRRGELRAEVDVAVAALYGLGFDALSLMLEDFPLLDRGQPALPGEAGSTVTRDLILATAARRWEVRCGQHAERVQRARLLGALAYVPAEHAGAYRARLPETTHA
ncbi:Eco57I restriction-modification methylase domain-containing protein [Deinococcus aestuarii]|uniref:Eco57I restriction-modification methylase domain-containing protein n=1 Tax=Deinococcus aestuarii TaxID=2774531 RepID=UPI001C0E8EC3|nr:N-6 DNA methylase [Deinococcus aestuarii]